MLRVAVISDTHIPSRANRIPDWVRTRIMRADHTIHAGDFDSADALASVHELTDGNYTAVSGNTDPASLRLPEVATLELGGVTFVVTHGTGPKRGYREACRTNRSGDGGRGRALGEPDRPMRPSSASRDTRTNRWTKPSTASDC